MKFVTVKHGTALRIGVVTPRGVLDILEAVTSLEVILPFRAS